MPLPTTRRARFLYRKGRYALRALRASSWKYVWVKNAHGHASHAGVKPWFLDPPKQLPCGVSSASYDASPFVPIGLTISYTVSAASHLHPPHVKITSLWYIAFRTLGKRQSFPLLQYHAKRVKAFRRLSSVKRTKRDRQITGCNWFFHLNGCFLDDDVLGRRPNVSDVSAGASPSLLSWPDPLGY